jgi:hypothetical protein
LCRRTRKCDPPASGCPAPQRGNGPRLDAEYLARHQSLLRRAVAREIERREREARRSGHPLAESGKPRASR